MLCGSISRISTQRCAAPATERPFEAPTKASETEINEAFERLLKGMQKSPDADVDRDAEQSPATASRN